MDFLLGFRWRELVERRCIALKNNDSILLNHGIHLPLIGENRQYRNVTHRHIPHR